MSKKKRQPPPPPRQQQPRTLADEGSALLPSEGELTLGYTRQNKPPLAAVV